MNVSSRTPEGQPNHCPLCGREITIEPSQPFGDAPCPSCGQLLWFVIRGEGLAFFDPEAAAPKKIAVRNFISKQLGVSLDNLPVNLHDFMLSLGADSLEVTELIMELEEEFDFSE